MKSGATSLPLLHPQAMWFTTKISLVCFHKQVAFCGMAAVSAGGTRPSRQLTSQAQSTIPCMVTSWLLAIPPSWPAQGASPPHAASAATTPAFSAGAKTGMGLRAWCLPASTGRPLPMGWEEVAVPAALILLARLSVGVSTPLHSARWVRVSEDAICCATHC